MSTDIIKKSKYYGNGDYTFINSDNSSVDFYINIDWAITECELWDWLANFDPGKKGFMFSRDTNIDVVIKKMMEQDIANYHTGSSLGVLLKEMHFMAQNGYDLWKKTYYPFA
jgi:hypothetical protein